MKKYRRSFMVNHTKEQIVDELSLIVENGGKVLNVIVAHDVYGQIQAGFVLENKKDVMDFMSVWAPARRDRCCAFQRYPYSYGRSGVGTDP